MTEAGFNSPVFDSQRVFRTLLTALSQPGRVLPIEANCAPPDGVDPAAAAILLTLCDADTSLWLSPACTAAAPFFRFRTGAPLVSSPGEALFLLAASKQRPALRDLRVGSSDDPDRSATLIVSVQSIETGRGWRVSGPGVDRPRLFLPHPVDLNLPLEWKAMNAIFPRGVDLLFVTPDSVVGLPRSARLED